MLLHPANPPKSDDKYVEKVFNWSEVHLSEMTCYKIHTLRSIESSPDTTLIAESDEDKLSETRNELPDKIEVELQTGNGFEILSEPKKENVVELQPKIIESTQSFHEISEEIVSETTE